MFFRVRDLGRVLLGLEGDAKFLAYLAGDFFLHVHLVELSSLTGFLPDVASPRRPVDDYGIGDSLGVLKGVRCEQSVLLGSSFCGGLLEGLAIAGE